jgi:hypothetical protein
MPTPTDRDRPVMLVIEYDGREYPIPLAAAVKLGSDRRLIDRVKAMAAVGGVRKPKDDDE